MTASLETRVCGRQKRRTRWAVAFFVAALAFLVIPVTSAYLNVIKESRIRASEIKVWEIDKLCQQYARDHNGVFPDRLEDLTVKDRDGYGPYLSIESIIDPWGKEFLYDKDGAENWCVGACLVYPNVWCVAPDGRLVGNFRPISTTSRNGTPLERFISWLTSLI